MDIQCHHQLEFNKNWKTKSIVLFKNFVASHLLPNSALCRIQLSNFADSVQEFCACWLTAGCYFWPIRVDTNVYLFELLLQ